MLLLGSADFVRRGLADGFADGRTGHAVLRGGDPVCQRLSRHVTEEEEVEEVVLLLLLVEVNVEVEEEAGGAIDSGWGEPGRTIKMSLTAAGRRVVPSTRRRRRWRRWGWWWWRTAAYTGENPMGEFMRRLNKTADGHTGKQLETSRRRPGEPENKMRISGRKKSVTTSLKSDDSTINP